MGQDQFNRSPGFPSQVASDTEAAQHDFEPAHALYALRAYDTSGNLSGESSSTMIAMPENDGCSHDVEGKRFIVVLDHLSEFAVLAGEPYHLYLPLIVRAE